MSSALDSALDHAEFDDSADSAKSEGKERTRQPRSDKGVPRTPRAASNKALIEDLLVPYAIIAEGLSLVAPTAAAVLVDRGEKTVAALVKIGARHPAMLNAMRKASVLGPGSELATTVFYAIIAGALDIGRIPPEHPLSVNTGVGQLYMEMHPERFEPSTNGGQSMPWPPPQGAAFTPPFVPAQGG
jgi:hypothetical protein